MNHIKNKVTARIWTQDLLLILKNYFDLLKHNYGNVKVPFGVCRLDPSTGLHCEVLVLQDKFTVRYVNKLSGYRTGNCYPAEMMGKNYENCSLCTY